MNHKEKTIQRVTLEQLEQLIKKVNKDQLYRVYPTLFDALLSKKLIPDPKPKKPVEIIESYDTDINEFHKGLPW